MALSTVLAALMLPGQALGRGYTDERFFPTALKVEDPFVVDEASIRLSHDRDETNTAATELTINYAQTITPDFALSIDANYLRLKPEDDVFRQGIANTVLGGKYVLHQDDAHELTVSLGVNLELGGTGSSRVGAESGSTLSPAILVAKGFSDLSESAKYLRPLAITCAISPNFSTRPFTAATVDTGFTISYDLSYLQNHVRDVHLAAPFNRFIPIVEVPLSTCTTGECSGQTTGTVNPGVIWHGKHFQLGLEAAIPINRASGNHPGVIVQLHFYLDEVLSSKASKRPPQAEQEASR